jgi:hypothetical protein
VVKVKGCSGRKEVSLLDFSSLLIIRFVFSPCPLVELTERERSSPFKIELTGRERSSPFKKGRKSQRLEG